MIDKEYTHQERLKQEKEYCETCSSKTREMLDNLDSLIDLQQQKVELLKLHKRSLIQHLIKNKIE